MYKIENSELDDEKGIFLAGTGLYEIIKNERFLLAAAESFKPNDIETSFDGIVDAAVKNYNAYTTSVALNPNRLEIELLTNFSDFFEIIIDIKKKEEVEKQAVAAAAGEDIAGTDNNPTVNEQQQQQPAKIKRSRNGN